MFAGLAYVLAHIAPEATAVLIMRPILKLISHAIDDKDRWRRLMFLTVPLIILAGALIAVGVWWLLGDGGLQIVLHGPWPVQSRPE